MTIDILFKKRGGEGEREGRERKKGRTNEQTQISIDYLSALEGKRFKCFKI